MYRASRITLMALLAGCGPGANGHDMAVHDLGAAPDLAATATFSGTVYLREADGGYPLAAALPPVPGVPLASDDGAHATSGADGKYTLTAGAGFRTLSAAPAGYIPIHASDEPKAGAASSVDVALYAAPAVIARPGFVKGLITFDAGGWINDTFFPSYFAPTYDTAVTRVSPSLVTLPDDAFIETLGTSTITLGTSSRGNAAWRMLNESEYAQLIGAAHMRGLEFMMFTGVFDDGSEQLLDGVGFNDIVYAATPPSSAFYDAYFAQFQQILVARAGIAERQGAEWLCVEQHAPYLTSFYKFASASDALARWTTLIDAVRAVYHGKLVYFGTASPVTYHNYESDGYAPGFVDLFDAIGIEIQGVIPTMNPSRADLVAGYRAMLGHQSFDRPLFVVLITPSVDGGTSFDTYIEPVVQANPVAGMHARNLWQQADAYEALFEAINGTPTGNGQAMGVFSWGYYYADEYLLGPRMAPLAMDKSANVRGKPAEAILDYWFKRL